MYFCQLTVFKYTGKCISTRRIGFNKLEKEGSGSEVQLGYLDPGIQNTQILNIELSPLPTWDGNFTEVSSAFKVKREKKWILTWWTAGIPLFDGKYHAPWRIKTRFPIDWVELVGKSIPHTPELVTVSRLLQLCATVSESQGDGYLESVTLQA